MGSEGDEGLGRRLGRYVLYEPIAAGGMASVHFGRMLGPVGFARTVAIKRLHAHLAHDPEFVSMFLDEARLAARVQHPNVVSTLDIVTTAGEVFLVMDYVKGESLAGLLRAARGLGVPVPPRVLVSIVVGALHGLHAAHEAKSDRGEPLSIVHRDVSPQNILVGEDGVARIVDFGVAKAAWRVQSTREGQIKGKLSYMAPEQARQKPIDRRTDLYAAGVILWEGLAGERLFPGDDPAGILGAVLTARIDPPSRRVRGIPGSLDRVVLRALSREPAKRFATAIEMASALEEALTPASQGAVAEWVRGNAGVVLERRAARLAAIEASPSSDAAVDAVAPVIGSSASAIRRLSNAPTAPEIVLPKTPEVDTVLDEPRSQLSIVSVTHNVKPARPERRAIVVVVGAVALLVVGVAVGARIPWSRVALPASAQGSSAPVTTSPSAVPSNPSLAPSSVARTMPEPATADAGGKGTSGGTARPARRPSGSAVTRKDCDPPYTLDPASTSPDGQPLKRFKPWCL